VDAAFLTDAEKQAQSKAYLEAWNAAVAAQGPNS